MRSAVKRSVCALLALLIMLPFFQSEAFAAGKSGVGMAEWALRAYNEGWKYVFGGEEVGGVDCSGLIRSYTGCWDNAGQLLSNAYESGSCSDMPNIHGLGLWCEGHAGVYVGKNGDGTSMAVDARNSKVNIVYSTMDSRSWNPWVKWFKIEGVSYPDTGWVDFNGSSFYYKNGEFVTGIYKVDGVSYDFGSSGALIGEFDESRTTTTAKPTTTKTTAKQSTTTAKTSTQKTTSTKASEKKTTTATEPETLLLKLGMNGDGVTRLQTRLKELGYLDARVTGYYGEQTVMAVRMFQKAVELEPDGIAGEKTQELLFADNAPKRTSSTKADATTSTAIGQNGGTSSTAKSTTTAPTGTTTTTPEQYYASLYDTLEFGMSGKNVEKLLDRLTELGYLEHKSDGYFGVFARLAVMAFQINTGLGATGIADPETQFRLYESSAPRADAEIDMNKLYGKEELEFDEGEYVAPVQEQRVELAASSGLDGYSSRADVAYFVGKYDSAAAIQTLGVLGSSEPTVTIYKNGESFELSGELSETIDGCVFF